MYLFKKSHHICIPMETDKSLVYVAVLIMWRQSYFHGNWQKICWHCGPYLACWSNKNCNILLTLFDNYWQRNLIRVRDALPPNFIIFWLGVSISLLWSFTRFGLIFKVELFGDNVMTRYITWRSVQLKSLTKCCGTLFLTMGVLSGK